MDIRLALMCGIDIPIPECQLVIHQPTLKEIAFVGEDTFFTGIQTICIHKSMVVEDKDVLEKTTNFQIFMMVIGDKESRDKKKDVKDILSLLFPDYTIIFSPQSLIFQKDGNSLIIDGENFDFLQDVVRDIACSKNGPMDQQAFNPANDKAREIAEKLMRGRQRVAAQKGASNSSVFSQYLSILTIALHIPLQNLLNLTMFQLYDLIERYSLYINWDLDIRTRLAGGTPDSHPDNWMKDIH